MGDKDTAAAGLGFHWSMQGDVILWQLQQRMLEL